MEDRIADAVQKEKEIWRPWDEKEWYHCITTTDDNYEMILSYYCDYKKHTG